MRDFKKALCRLGKAYQVPDKSPINITRAINATKITSKLNLRIRLPYACAQLISPSPAGLRLAAPITLHGKRELKPFDRLERAFGTVCRCQ